MNYGFLSPLVQAKQDAPPAAAAVSQMIYLNVTARRESVFFSMRIIAFGRQI